MSVPPQTPTTPVLAWIDARNGVAGDMLLGALVDAGASLAGIQEAVEAVMPATVALSSATVQRGGQRACKVDVSVLVDDLPHRDWTTIRSMLQAASLKPAVKERAVAVFEALARAEASAHGIDVERVHFHEVGAWDSIADVVGVCAGLDELGASQILASPVGVGSGSIRTAHGEIPIPVPAVLELAKGWSVLAGGKGELATPTGMALVTTLADAAPTLPECRVLGVGIGAGSRDDAGRPNVVRLVLGEVVATDSPSTDAWVLEANVDDLDPRVWPSVLESLLYAGADDAWLSPILMKKGRPAHTLHVLASPSQRPALRDLVFQLVPTLGLREYAVIKRALPRVWRPVQVGEAEVRIKLGLRLGRVTTATPEFADVLAVAEAAGRPVRDVLTAANAAAVAAGLTSGAALPQ